MKDYKDVLILQNQFLYWMFSQTKVKKENFWQMNVCVPSWAKENCNLELHLVFVRREYIDIFSKEYENLGKYKLNLDIQIHYDINKGFRLLISNGVDKHETIWYKDMTDLICKEKDILVLLMNNWITAGGLYV